MKSLFIAGNWKSNKTVAEVKHWIEKMKPHDPVLDRLSDITMVVVAPFTVLYELKKEVAQATLPMYLGAQDVSPFSEGAYTGEISAHMIKELADYVIIGHSERRKYFNEGYPLLQDKVNKAKEAGLKVIFCVPDEKTIVAKGADIVAYEPVWAIGTGKTDTPENANAVCAKIKETSGIGTIIYGGSVVADNVESFVNQGAIDGVLPGGASLDSEKFYNLIMNAARRP